MAIDASVDLRALVREVLRETIAPPGASAAAPVAAPVAGVQHVSVANDADLQAFITRLTVPGALDAVRAGRLRFALVTAPATPQNHGAPAIMTGVISERKLHGLPPGSTVLLAAAAVVTPMGKDVARRLKLNFERIG